MKKSLMPVFVIILIALLAIPLAACAPKTSAADIQKAVAATLAAAPVQPAQEVTQLVEVTRVVEMTTVVEATAEDTSTPTDTPAVTDTATPTEVGTLAAAGATPTTAGVQPGTPLNWSLQYFVSRYNFMTDLQKQQFVTTLPGRTVSWYAIMDNVTIDGLVMMRFPYGMYGAIVLKGVPADTAAKINRGYQVEFTGMIESFDSQSSNQLVLTNVRIVSFYPEPTPTITLTPTPVTPTPVSGN